MDKRVFECSLAAEADLASRSGEVLRFWRFKMSKLMFRAAIGMAAMLCASVVMEGQADAGLFKRHKGGGCGGCESSCAAEPSCGCAAEPSCAAPAEPSCGCAAAEEPSCGCAAAEPSCGCESSCDSGCGHKRHKLFGGRRHKGGGCGGCSSSCESSCGCPVEASCAAPSDGGHMDAPPAPAAPAT